MKSSFVLTRLALVGDGKTDAVVEFGPGLNVIVGPSDTGKTFIFQCIDYALGASAPPKGIPESEGYESAVLGLCDGDGLKYQLTRSLRGGGIRLASDGHEVRTLSPKHDESKPDNVSAFLLDLIDLLGKRVRTNATGVTRSLSFRDVAHLAFVNEEAVMTSTSPAFTGQHTAKTVESRILRLLLTGEDDSSVVAAEDRKLVQARVSGHSEILHELIASASSDRQRLSAPATLAEAERELDRAAEAVDEAAGRLTAAQASTSGIEDERRETWKSLRVVQSRLDVLEELQKRFDLLAIQYGSDLRRLDAIAEASSRIDQMQEERCPVCGALAEHHQAEHEDERVGPSDVQKSCLAEAEKIRLLVRDLDETRESNKAEINDLSKSSHDADVELRRLDDELANALRPAVAAATKAFREAETIRRCTELALEAVQRETELKSRLSSEEGVVLAKPEKLPKPGISVSDAGKFTRRVEDLLKSWHFPNLERVEFSESAQDIVISGRERASYGQGIRAITHAAFALALLRHALDDAMPYVNVVAIDSPLVVYREPDPEDGAFPESVKDHFYESLATTFNDAQVLIFENDAPPKGIEGQAKVIAFTKANHGRYGFIPRTDV